MDRAVRVFWRRIRFYALLTAGTLALQCVTYYFVRGDRGLALTAFIFPPLLTTVANIRSALDFNGADVSAAEFFEWCLSRLWAVMLIDAVVWLAFGQGALLAFYATPAEALLGIGTVILTATLFFADVYASIEPQGSSLLVIPFAFARSMRLSWQNGNMIRLLALAIFQVALLLLQVMFQQILEAQHVRGAAFLANVPLSTILTAPFAALVTAIYLDCIAREREATS